MTSTFTPNINLEEPANGDYTNNWNVPLNANLSKIDAVIGGVYNFNVVGASGTIAITSTQYTNRILVFNGLLTANVNYQFPSGVGGSWIVYNNTTGAFTVTLSSGGAGTTYQPPRPYFSLVATDGVNVFNGLTAPGAAAGSTHQVQWNNSGVLTGSSGLTFDGTTLTAAALAGPLTGNVTGNLTGNVTGNITGQVGTSGYGVGYINIPPSSNTTPAIADVGKYLKIPSGTTINSGIFSDGDVFALVNNTASSVTITQGASVTLRQAGTTNTGSRTLAAYSSATVMCVGSNTFFISGSGIS